MEEEVKKCPRCPFRGPLSCFVGVQTGALLKTCHKCREKQAARSKAEKLKKKKEVAALTIANPDLRTCQQCMKQKKFSEFNILRDGVQLSLKCSQCLLHIKEVTKVNVARHLAENPEEYRKRCNNTSKKSIAKRREADPDGYKAIQTARQKKYHEENQVAFKLREIKNNAKARNIAFYITDDEARDLIQQPCFYCLGTTEGGVNGIDRVVNSDMYILHNCVSACNLCNSMKSEWDYESFISYVGHISAFSGRFGSLCQHRLFDYRGSTYKQCRVSALDRGIEFNLSEDEFDKIVKDDCYLCGKKKSNVHSNGVDRYVNENSYDSVNSKACCTGCNKLKNVWSHADILIKCEIIYNLHHAKIVPLGTPFTKSKRLLKNMKKRKRKGKKKTNQKRIPIK